VEWYRGGAAAALILEYYALLRSVLRAKPHLRVCLTRCRHCGIFFLTHPRNARRRDLHCPFGCREAHRRQASAQRSAAYYPDPKGRRKSDLNQRRPRKYGPPKPAPDPPQPQLSPPRSELRLPPPAPNQLTPVRDYLIAARHLPTGLVAALIDSGTLYADARTNAVFLLCDDHRLPVGAELRGTTATPWHGLAPGSRKDLGCFAIPAEPRSTVVLCESAIDAISCFVLHPAYRCLSTAGARPEPRWLRPLLEQGCQVYCGFDADPTGNAMADAMITLYPRVQRLRPTRHDWNDVLKARP
jgi:hypothetical protein